MPTSRPCPACASTAPPAEMALDEMMFGLDESFDYATCADCGSLFISAIPDDLADYYSTKYYSFDLDPQAVMGRPGIAGAVRVLGRSALLGRNRLAGAAARTIPVRQVQTTLDLFGSVRVAGLPRGEDTRVLDVGCGSGALVYALSLVGLPDVVGTDPFNESDQTFDTGARVLRRDLAELDESYDLIMLHHCLEHVPEPRTTLEQVKARLRPGGRALVRMPTVSSYAYDHYGRDWMQLDPPRHLTVFSRSGMEQASTAAGLRIEQVVDDSTAFQFWASEQAAAGVPLVADNSHFTHPRESAFDRRQVAAWGRRARALNSQHRGDQAMWVLTAG